MTFRAGTTSRVAGDRGRTMPGMDALIGVIVVGAIATIAPIVVEYLRGSREEALDRQKRADDRRIERNRIQRETLLELQEGLNEFMRGSASVHLADVDSIRRTGKLHRLPPGTDAQAFEAGRRFMFLTERVLDDGLRATLTNLRALEARLEIGKIMDRDEVDEGRLDRDFAALGQRASEAQATLGAELRKYL